MHIAETINDSSMVNTMMDHIATNGHMRVMMMQKMIHHTKADSTGMMEMCKTMTDDKEMHGMMMKAMEGGMMKDSDTMQHGMRQIK